MVDWSNNDVLDLLSGHSDDANIERIAFECLVHGLTDSRVQSLMNILQWPSSYRCFALGGTPKEHAQSTEQALHQVIHDFGGTHALVGATDSFVILLACEESAVRPEMVCTSVLDSFSSTHALYLSSERENLEGAALAIHETMYSLQAAPALQTLPRPLRGDDVLPERALLGDEVAREELYVNVYCVLQGDGSDAANFETVSTFLHHGGSLEATAKELNVHPNTVRYRLKRTAETSGWDATDPRDAYVLTTALAIGRMRNRS
ncbi:polyketide synthase regulator [Bifidobacterium dolichotidis]|uniref:Polyketide synthase regulator n=1 Tax=Bifidobacterium dolichotidis TaxID=2306976 RepID=A0A430FQF2_9BIFI|nr:helix-turn-helix domain-containing protein [Bifidobacterium dolichotidis]RSX55046.1 polyketide synthase regulator [Bifidobacterium dolichotidis]